MIRRSEGKIMFVAGLVSTVLAMAFITLAWYSVTNIADLSVYRFLMGIGLAMSGISLVFFARGLTVILPKGKKVKSGIAILIAGGAILMVALFFVSLAFFALWAANDAKGFSTAMSMSLVLALVAAMLLFWGFRRVTFVENASNLIATS